MSREHDYAKFFLQHAEHLQQVLKHPQNGNILKRNYDKFDTLERVLIYAAVCSELASVPLLLINIWALLKNQKQPFLTEGNGTAPVVNPMIAQYPILSQPTNLS